MERSFVQKTDLKSKLYKKRIKLAQIVFTKRNKDREGLGSVQKVSLISTTTKKIMEKA